MTDLSGYYRKVFNTRWRDFADLYLLSRRHPVNGAALGESIEQVAMHRRVERLPLATVLDGYGAIGQTRWAAWRRRQHLEDRLPEQFDDLVAAVVALADPAILGEAEGRMWEPGPGSWRQLGGT